MGYSRRVFDIVKTLLSKPGYVSWEIISTDLHIAKRTIFREMKAVEKLVKSLDMTLNTKTRLGVWLEATTEARLSFDVMYKGCDDKTLTQEARYHIMTCELLRSVAPQKLFYYASKLGVSEATISHDMDRLVPWFESKNIKLLRKPGLGVYLEGSELNIRRALVDYLYENHEHQSLVNFISYTLDDPLLKDGILDKYIFLQVRQVLSDFEAILMTRLTENAYTSLTIHLTIAVQRVLRGDRIHMHQEVLSQLRQDIQFEISRAIGASISERFHIVFPEDELGYITMHLMGAKLKTTSMVANSDMVLSNFEMTRQATRMMRDYEKQTGIALSGDEDLLIGLVSHLKPAMTRLQLALAIRNPLLNQIKELYPEIFLVTTNVSKSIEKDYGLILPESEIGFLAMHFGAAIERLKRKENAKRPVRIALVCASGIGTSSLLSSRIAKHFDEVIFTGQYAKQEIEQMTEFETIDFVVTTVALDTMLVPVVLVNPLVGKSDLALIEKSIDALRGLRFTTFSDHKIANQVQNSVVKPPNHIATVNPLDKARKIHRISETVLQIAEGFLLTTLETAKVKSVDQLIDLVAHETALHLTKINMTIEENQGDNLRIGFVNSDTLSNAFKTREKMGSTLLKGDGVMLLHAKILCAIKPYVGVCQLKSPWKHPSGELVESLVVMLISQDASIETSSLLSFISQGLIEDNRFLMAVRGERLSGVLGVVDDKGHHCSNLLDSRMAQWLERTRGESL